MISRSSHGEGPCKSTSCKASRNSHYDPTRRCRLSVPVSSSHVTISVPTSSFSLLRAELYIQRSFIHVHIYGRVRSRGDEDRGGDEGRSLDNALDDVAINRARRGMRGGTRGGRRAPCALSLRSDAHPVRYQTSHIDHVVGRRSFRYMR